MRQGDHKLFNDQKKLYLLVNLRIEGYRINSLSSLFHCDKAAVRLKLNKYNILPENGSLSLRHDVSNIKLPAVPNTKVIDGEVINIGHSYKDYLARYSPRI